MAKRIDLAQVQLKALTAMLSIENYQSKVELSGELKEIIKVRAPIANKCAYCIQMHTTEALKIGFHSQNCLLSLHGKNLRCLTKQKEHY